MYMYLINIHKDFMTSQGDLNFLKNISNVQNLTICNKNLLCLNNVTFFDFYNTFFNKIIYIIAF